MQIKGHNLNDELITEIGTFAVLWGWFEKNYCSNKCTPTLIIDIAEYISINNKAQEDFAVALNARREWFEQLYTDYDYIATGLYSEDRTPNKMARIHIGNFLEQCGGSVAGCLLCVQRIRNNMMHGLKNLETLNEQISIFETANAVLESIGRDRR